MAQHRLEARFILSAARPDQFPAEPANIVTGEGTTAGEVAFLGRSNVGKSSLLNALVGQFGYANDKIPGGRKKLAFESSRPGCTQVINFFQMGDDLHLVDLPGYGYAKVPAAIQQQWQHLIESYLTSRTSLRLCVLLIDARRGWMDKDLELKTWLEFHGRKYIVAVTKIDKLTQREFAAVMTAVRQQAEGVEIVPVSAATGRGVRELWQTIWKIHNQ